MTIIYKFREKKGNRKLGITKGDLATWLGSDGDCTEEEVQELYYE